MILRQDLKRFPNRFEDVTTTGKSVSGTDVADMGIQRSKKLLIAVEPYKRAKSFIENREGVHSSFQNSAAPPPSYRMSHQ